MPNEAHQQGQAPQTTAAPDRADMDERARWQRRVLPVMVFAIIGAGIFFAVAIIQEVRTLYPRLEQAPVSLTAQFERFEAERPEMTGDLDYLRFKALALLEADALQRRYQQANAALLSRVWTRQMGFMTGMLMALIGAAFILGRIEMGETRMSAGTEGTDVAGTFNTALATTSPGIVLAVLGTGLMAMTIAIPGRVSTTDTPVYLLSAIMEDVRGGANGFTLPGDPPPLPLPPEAVGCEGPEPCDD